jgi:hypothetical protein
MQQGGPPGHDRLCLLRSALTKFQGLAGGWDHVAEGAYQRL